MKRLFELNGEYYDNKAYAKTLRDLVGGVIHKGPDHWKYGVKAIARAHSHDAKSGGHGNGFPNKRK
jgi:hypothetical protein